MPRILPDAEIDALIREKILPERWESRFKPKPAPDGKYLRRRVDVTGEDGSSFVVDVRVTELDQLDFSVILSFVDTDGERYILTRFNGKHASEHTNQWEKRHGQQHGPIRLAFHIHRATERYQVEGLRIDGYAEVTTEYASLHTAIRSFIRMNGFVVEGEDTPLLDNREEGASE